MPRPQLIDDRGEERDFQLEDGRVITLHFDQDEFECRVNFSENGNSLGDEFIFIDEYENGDRFLLGRMYSPIPQSGLGRAVLEYFIDMTDASIYVRPHDGITRDDGSHLTGDAPLFVRKMREEGLIEEEGEEYYNED